MSTPEEQPHPESALARAHAARAQLAAALGEEQGREPGEAMGRQPIWKWSRTPKSNNDVFALSADRFNGAGAAAEM